MRGVLTRNKTDLRKVKGYFDATRDTERLLHNKLVNKIRMQEGPFNFKALEKAPVKIPGPVKLVTKESFRMINGSVYTGQWSPKLLMRAG